MKHVLTMMKGYLNPKVLVFFGLGLASQAPVNLIGGTLKYWFSTEGVDLKKIGLFGLVLMPYAFKFLWAPFIDRINLPLAGKIGRKRTWGFVMLIMTMFLLCDLSFLNPTGNLIHVFVVCFLIAFCSSTYDIAVDGLRIDLLSGDDLKQGSAVYQLGARIGFLMAVAGMIFISSYVSWRTAYQLSIGIVCIGFVSLCFLKEKKKEQSDFSFREFAVEPFRDLIKRENFLNLCLFIVLYKLCNGVLGPMAYPFYHANGFTAEQVSVVSGTFGVFITMVGIFLGGLLMLKYPYRPMLICLGLLEILTSFSFAWLSQMGPDIRLFFLVILFDNIVGGIGGAVWVAYLSGICSRTYSATQYSFLIALTMVPLSVIASGSGYLVEQMGWGLFFIFTGFLMVPALFMLSSKRSSLNFQSEKK